MTLCEMCGREDSLVNSNVEGIDMSLCSGCSKYGQIKKNDFNHYAKSLSTKKSDNQQQFRIVNNYSSLLKSARMNKSMKQEDFAKVLQEKESLVSKWESGRLRPSVEVAKKIGRILNINFIEHDINEVFENKNKKSNDVFTLGDFIKKKK